MSAKTFKQEMPPEGGFGPIHWAKQAPKPFMRGSLQFGLFTGFVSFWMYVYYKFGYQRGIKQQVELTDAMISVQPLLEAEKHRMFLIHMRKNRDYENELMKDYPGWVTGTLFGEPVYHNKRDRFIAPFLEEYYAHTAPKHMHEKMYSKTTFEY